MKVATLMHSRPAFCSTEATLTIVASKMRDVNGGFVPIVDEANRVVGIVTARDLVLALSAEDKRPSEIQAAQVMSTPPITCHLADSVDRALQRMATLRVRRLVVVDDAGVLKGVLSLRDLVPVAQGVRAGVDRVSYEQIMETLNQIYAP
jgi:CBS domain-containing protein